MHNGFRLRSLYLNHIFRTFLQDNKTLPTESRPAMLQHINSTVTGMPPKWIPQCGRGLLQRADTAYIYRKILSDKLAVKEICARAGISTSKEGLRKRNMNNILHWLLAPSAAAFADGFVVEANYIAPEKKCSFLAALGTCGRQGCACRRRRRFGL